MTTTAEKLRQMVNAYPRGEYSIDTLEISHPLLTQTYYFTREPGGLTAFLEDGITEVEFIGTQIELQLNETKDDLDQNFNFTFADLDNMLDDEMDRIPLNDITPVSVVYRSYISTDLSAPAITYYVDVLDVSQSKGSFTLTCGVSQLNWARTGIRYTLDAFPMLRAL